MTARRGAEEQLKRWCWAYEVWLAEREQRHAAATIKLSKITSRRLLQ